MSQSIQLLPGTCCWTLGVMQHHTILYSVGSATVRIRARQERGEATMRLTVSLWHHNIGWIVAADPVFADAPLAYWDTVNGSVPVWWQQLMEQMGMLAVRLKDGA